MRLRLLRQRYVDEHGLDRLVTKLMNGALDGFGIDECDSLFKM